MAITNIHNQPKPLQFVHYTFDGTQAPPMLPIPNSTQTSTSALTSALTSDQFQALSNQPASSTVNPKKRKNDTSKAEATTNKKARLAQPKKIQLNARQLEAEYHSLVKKFAPRLKLLRNSEKAEYNFGKPDNLSGNPFAGHWHQLDRQHQALYQRMNTFFRMYPTANLDDYAQYYTANHRHGAGVEFSESPESHMSEVNWLNEMRLKRNSPPQPLTTVWDLLNDDDKQFMFNASQYLEKHPGDTIKTYIDDYAKEYNTLSRQGKSAHLLPPTELAKKLTLLNRLLFELRKEFP